MTDVFEWYCKKCGCCDYVEFAPKECPECGVALNATPSEKTDMDAPMHVLH